MLKTLGKMAFLALRPEVQPDANVISFVSLGRQTEEQEGHDQNHV
jgi:hypothetical protein